MLWPRTAAPEAPISTSEVESKSSKGVEGREQGHFPAKLSTGHLGRDPWVCKPSLLGHSRV